MASSFLRDLRYALRTLGKTPGFTLVVCGILALGIGANSALFTVVHKVLLEPLPFHESERLVEIRERSGKSAVIPVSWPNYQDWLRAQSSFEPLAFAAISQRVIPSHDGSQSVPVAYVTGNFFETYRVSAALGRTFSDAEDTPGAPPVAVLSRGFWLDRFGGDPLIAGKTIRVDTVNATVIGVLPDFPWHREARLFLPVSHGVQPLFLSGRENHNSSSVTGRLKPGVTLERGTSDIAAIEERLAKEYPGANRDLSVHAVSLHEWVTSGSKRTILALYGAVSILLLLVCVNIANMMLARSLARTREFSVRLALGAGRGVLIQQLLTECLVLGFTGALLGLLLSRVLLPLLASFAPPSIAPGLAMPDWRIFAFTAFCGLFAAVVFGSAPALAASRVDLHQSLKDRGATAHGRHVSIRGALVGVQVALALVLLTGAGLFLRSLNKVLEEDPGFRTEQLLALNVSLPAGEDSFARLAERFAAMEERVRTMPGVTRVASTSFEPFSAGNSNAQFVPEGFESRPGTPLPAADYRATSSDYFATLGVPLLKGRMYSKADGVVPPIGLKGVMQWFSTAHYQVVINEEMARRFWPGQDPIGRRFRFGPPSLKGALMTVCGVVGNVRQRGLDRAPQPTFYISSWMYPFNEQSLLIRTTLAPGKLAPALRRVLLEAEPAAVVSDAKTLEGVIRQQTSSRRSNLTIMGAFASLALLLAAIGIYGVIAYSVGLRSREFAVRMALGATAGRVVGSVLAGGAKLILAGLAVGVIAAVWLSNLIAGMLYGIKPADPWSYGAACLLLFVAGLAAALVPALRASGSDPIQSLRAE